MKPHYATATPLLDGENQKSPEFFKRRGSDEGFSVRHQRWLSGVDELLLESFLPSEHLHPSFCIQDDEATVKIENDAFKFYFGSLTSAAIYVSGSVDSISLLECDLAWCIENDLLDELSLDLLVMQSSLFRILQLFTVVARIYENLPGATINVRILDRPLTETIPGNDILFKLGSVPVDGSIPWPVDLDFSKISLEQALALVAYLDGAHDVPVGNFENVMAISLGDSLYVTKKVSGPSCCQSRTELY